jgi:alkaline phosphatase D
MLLVLGMLLSLQAHAKGIVGDTLFQYEISQQDIQEAELPLGPFEDAHNAEGAAFYDPSHSTTYFPNLPSRIAFGSCNFQRLSQGHFNTISSLKPDVWIWLGDIIYADILSMNLRRGEYRKVKSSKGYEQLRKNGIVLGVWDDHDYGKNNVGQDFPEKKATQKALLDFLDESESSPRRAQEGIYWTYRFGPADKQLRIILLDLRYFREVAGVDNDLLGEAQWRFLERELAQGAKPMLTLIGSSTQFIPTEHGGDRWDQYPKARERILGMIRNLPEKVVFLSGDVHYGEISRMKLVSGKEIEEVTASGMTHAAVGRRAAPNRTRVGAAVEKNHFGWIQLDWSSAAAPTLSYELRGVDGKVLEAVKATMR